MAAGVLESKDAHYSLPLRSPMRPIGSNCVADVLDLLAAHKIYRVLGVFHRTSGRGLPNHRIGNTNPLKH